MDAYASEGHYCDHLAPIWAALPDAMRGQFRCATPPAAHRAREIGVLNLERKLSREWLQPRNMPVMVASYNDLRRCKGRPAVFVEHGAGQSYGGDDGMKGSPWYPGGVGRHDVRLFVCPNESVAERNRALYPEAAYAVVGSPRLDELWRQRQASPRDGRVLTVGCSFHWTCHLCPECGWAWPEYASALAEAVHETARYPRPWRWLGHYHPRAVDKLHRWWAEIGAIPVHDFATIAREADVFVADNTSAIYEAAALGIPVVLVNSQHWRRDIDHGLRFWDQIPGPQVDEPSDLLPTIDRISTDPDEWEPARLDVAAAVYAIQPPDATHAAAAAIAQHLSDT